MEIEACLTPKAKISGPSTDTSSKGRFFFTEPADEESVSLLADGRQSTIGKKKQASQLCADELYKLFKREKLKKYLPSKNVSRHCKRPD